MRPDDRVAAYIWDMLDAARTVHALVQGVDLPQYLHDRKLQLAIERAVEIIGEAACSRGLPASASRHSMAWHDRSAQRPGS